MTTKNRNPGAGNAGASAADNVLATRKNTSRATLPKTEDQAHRCTHCTTAIPADQERGRPQKFCSDACRQAHRKVGASRGNGLRYRTPRPSPKSPPQVPELEGESTPENRSPETNPLHFERVNAVTFKITDNQMSRVPTSHGQWAGHNTTRALAWVIDIGSTAGGSPAWLARCRDRVCGPLTFDEAKAAAFAMAKGAAGDVLVDPIKFLLRLQTELIDLEGEITNE